jgi:hypothetical protein
MYSLIATAAIPHNIFAPIAQFKSAADVIKEDPRFSIMIISKINPKE